jgi:hypothetical protein
VNLYGGHNVGFDAAHKMTFDPIMVFAGSQTKKFIDPSDILV